MITRLNGMPSQMLAMMTAHSELSLLSHHTPSEPNSPSSLLSTPESASIIHCHVVPDTMIGSSQGTRKRPRSTPEIGKLRWKKTARASPMEYWKTSETTTNVAVWPTVGQNGGEPTTSP